MDRCRLLTRKIGGGSFALIAEFANQRLSAVIEEVLHAPYFGRIFVIGAAFETRCEAHLHLGIDAAREFRVGIEIFDAAAHLEEIQRVVHELLGSNPRDKWAVVQVLSASFAEPRGDGGARILVIHMKLHKWSKPKTQPLLVSFRKCRAQDAVKQET